MRQKCMTILKVSVALILALMMVVGSISTVVAATITIEQAESAADSTVTDVTEAPADNAEAPADNADDAEDVDAPEDAPAQSAPLTDKLIRLAKDDIAATGADVDFAKTGDWNTSGKNNIKISFDDGNNWHSYNTNSDGYIDFIVPYDCTAQFEFWADYSGTSYKFLQKSGDGTPASGTTSTLFYGRRTDAYSSGQEFSSSLTAGQYVVKYDSFDTYGSTNGGTLKFYWYRKEAKAYGDITGSWDTYNAMSYDEYQGAYYYEFTASASNTYFRLQYGINGTYTGLQGASNNLDLSSYNSKSSAYTASTSGYNNAYKLPTTSGTKYRVWLSKEWDKVWWSTPEDLSTTDYYFGNSGNNWGATHTDDKKFTRQANGTYTFEYSLSNDYQFCIQSAGGTMFRMKAQNAWEVQASNVDSGVSYNMVTNSDGHNLSWEAGSADVIITFDPSTPSIKFDTAATSYYLTGYLNNGAVTGNTYAFTNTSGSTWTYSFAPTDDHSGYQYMTVKASDGTVYHPATHGSGSGTEGTNTDTVADGDNKWKVAAISGQTVNLTWDDTTHVLSWTVSGSSGMTDTDYKLFESENSSGIIVASPTAVNSTVKQINGTYKYYINLSGAAFLTNATTGKDYYFALSEDSTYSKIFGIDSGSSANPKAANVTVSGDTYFKSYSTQNYNSQINSTNYSANYARIQFETKPNYLYLYVDYNQTTANTVTYYFVASDSEITDGDSAAVSVVVYAKDGAAPINWDSKSSGGASATSGTAYNYAAIATTTLTATGVTATSVSCGNDSSKYQTASIDAGTTITVTTTIADSNSWRNKYYVVGWSVNGVTYNCAGKPGVNAETDTSSGVCTMTYTIPTEPDDLFLEITPIYYIKDNAKTTASLTCITFYLEGYNTVQDKWGNTPYIYPFYGDNNNIDNSFGCYPGQPMVYAEGKYSTEIPLTSYNIVPNEDTTGIAIKGITISNGYADHVHRNLVYGWTDHDNDADHRQTYDYDDFAKIYNECLTNAAATNVTDEHPNSIIFRIQDESKTYNRYTYGGSKSGARVIANDETLDATDLSNISSGNGWEVLRNRYGQPIDLFGTVVSEPSGPTTVSDANVRVVSTGYNANIAGDYGTAWKVYKYSTSTAYSLIKDTTTQRYAAPPSIFLLRGTNSGYASEVDNMNYPAASRSVDGPGVYTDDIDQYEGIYMTAKGNDVAGKPVYITYEMDAQDTRSDSSGTGAYRLDGRWYYTHSSDNVQSTVSIEYYNKSTGKWVSETPAAATGLGATSGNKVEFLEGSYSSASAITTSSSALINDKQTWYFKATAGSGYIFDSWQIKYSSTSYDQIVGAGASSSIKATANYELVARFMPVVAGTLTITHQLAKASTGEGTVGMVVSVGGTDQTVTVENGVARAYISTGITNASTDTVSITLTTTPLYDGTVTEFGYDAFNTQASITPSIKDNSDVDAELPGGDGEVRKSVFEFTVAQLFAGATQTNDTLAYTSTIAETPHYYNFVYQFTSRGSGTANDKSYTSKGEISLKDYKAYVSDTPSSHTMDNSYLIAKAPFESNFLKSNSLSKGAIFYASHTFSATSTFTETASIPTYTVTFKLPYNYHAASDTSASPAYKKYNASEDTYVPGKATFDLLANYDTFVTINATDAVADTEQANVQKVPGSDTNHVGNNFITAPDTLYDSDNNKTMYFNYWQVRKKADTAEKQAAAPIVSRVYYPDFHYRIYGDYYVEAVYSDNEDDIWYNTYKEDGNIGCYIIYLGDSRNQWNNPASGDSADAADAADKIYNDFIFNYNYKGDELSGSDDVEVGMILERVVDGTKWATGSTSVNDMTYYQDKYGAAGNKTAIANHLNSGATQPVGMLPPIPWSNSDLNNKNFTEQNYSFYSAYGQDVEDNSIAFAADSSVDNYVYRAYAYIKYKDANGNYVYCVSDPAYFCMRYTANLKYSE